ncbi:MAG: ABC transporter substrate-binding protein [Magnetococcales bacterium]|nr:ABC transporter substrate-binding protein [Magnetococcales bacterium]
MFVRQGVLMLLGVVAFGVVMLLGEAWWMPRTGLVADEFPGKSNDRLSNPRYSGYQFAPPSASVIDAGYQPVAMPTGTMPAVMMHDRILVRQLENLGKTLKFHPFLEGGDSNVFLFHGHLEMVWAGDLPTIKAAAAYPIVVTAQTKTAFAAVVAHDLFSISQLKGRRIGYAPGSSAHQVLLLGLSSSDMDERDVQLVAMPVNKMLPEIRAGRIDAFAAWEPTPTIAMDQMQELSVVYRGLTQSYLYFSKAFTESNLELVHILTAANLRAVRWMRSHPDHARQACQWHLGLAETFLKEPYPISIDQCLLILHRDLLDPLPMTMFPPETWQRNGIIARQFRFLLRMGVLPPHADLNQILRVFNADILGEIVQNRERWDMNVFDYQ